MIPHRTMTRFAAVVLLAAASFGIAACSSSSTSTGPVAAFTPDENPPPAPKIEMLSGSGSGTSINVRVTVTGVPQFFGAAFKIQYNTTALVFNGMDDSASFLRQGGVTGSNLLFVENHNATPGEIIITATRIDPTVAPPIDVTTTADLVVLNFVAAKSIAAGASEGHLDFIDPKQACNGTVVPPECGAITVAWSGGGVSAQ